MLSDKVDTCPSCGRFHPGDDAAGLPASLVCACLGDAAHGAARPRKSASGRAGERPEPRRRLVPGGARRVQSPTSERQTRRGPFVAIRREPAASLAAEEVVESAPLASVVGRAPATVRARPSTMLGLGAIAAPSTPPVGTSTLSFEAPVAAAAAAPLQASAPNTRPSLGRRPRGGHAAGPLRQTMAMAIALRPSAPAEVAGPAADPQSPPTSRGSRVQTPSEPAPPRADLHAHEPAVQAPSQPTHTGARRPSSPTTPGPRVKPFAEAAKLHERVQVPTAAESPRRRRRTQTAPAAAAPPPAAPPAATAAPPVAPPADDLFGAWDTEPPAPRAHVHPDVELSRPDIRIGGHVEPDLDLGYARPNGLDDELVDVAAGAVDGEGIDIDIDVALIGIARARRRRAVGAAVVAAAVSALMAAVALV